MNLSVATAKSAVSPLKVEVATRDFAPKMASFEGLRNLRLAQFPFAATMNSQSAKGSALKPHEFLGEIEPIGLFGGKGGCLALSAYESIPYAVLTALDCLDIRLIFEFT